MEIIKGGKEPKKIDYGFTLETLQKAYNNGELKFNRTLLYRGELAPKGHIFYIIRYDTGGKNVYFGAYKMNLDVESDLLKTPGYLQAYLCLKLAPILTAYN